ncbi:uncharacterized protein LOC133917345 isoform X2 [Phragmites australis]|uniref:uncharacterized protein LOC133917345 isoform X2 n=1 Tax=Phragmites australis TaxID=29695 RepID=UPI002D77F410|nr:uncharacterized protein LOC133917345 isoform X2 [Phragmites australis]
MGHSSGAVESAACRVLAAIDEDPEAEGSGSGSGSPETTRMAERRKAIVSRMRELLQRAAAAQSAHSKLRRSTVATAKKWKRVVGRIQNRGASATACKDHQRTTLQDQGDGMMMSSSSSFSSNSSFSWDAAAESSCPSAMSPASYSPVLWPAFGTKDQMPSPATTVLRLSCTSSNRSSVFEGEMEMVRMAQWITTDSDFVVLEL